MDKSDISIPIQSEPMNWGQIIKSLIRQTGNEDVVQQLILDFLNPDKEQLGFDPRKVDNRLSLQDGVTRFLSGVAKNRLKDRGRSVTRDRSRLKSLDSGGGGQGGDDNRPFEGKELASSFRSPENDLIAAQFAGGLIALVPEDTEAKDVIKAALDITGGGRVHQELAESVYGDAKAAKKVRNTIKRICRAVENEERNGRNLPWMIRTTTAPQKRSTGITL